MVNITWRRFDQSAKQLVVGHTTLQSDSVLWEALTKCTSRADFLSHSCWQTVPREQSCDSKTSVVESGTRCLAASSVYNAGSNRVEFLQAWWSNSALTLLVGRQEKHLVCKNWVMRCWCGYLSAARCRLFAYGPADATAISKPHHLLPHFNPDWFYLSGTDLPRLSLKRGR